MEIYGGRGNRWRVVWMLVVMLGMQECTGHIRLTYPPARKYHFDFLDNVRTPGPCGMPKGLDNVHTNLEAGSNLDIHWHLSYPHQGGYFFELRDSNNTVRARYPPTTGFEGTSDGTSLGYSINLPTQPCEDCVFRMLRQAQEWSPGYLFWSCADVNIVAALQPSDRCSGRGTYLNGQCTCDKLYKGDRCQFEDECDVNADCGPHGMCVDTQATSYPIHQCYCEQGWFGRQCQKQSSVTTKPTDMSVYTELSVGSNVTVYYRIVQDEVEVMMKAKTVSWMGLGWRPAGTQGSCQNFPDLGVGNSRFVPEGNGVAESEGEPETEGEHEGEPGAESEHHGNSTAEAEGTAESEVHPEGEAEHHGNSTAEAEGTAESEVHPEGEAEHHGNSTAEAEGTAESEVHPEGEAEHHGNSTAEAEGTAESEVHPEGEAEHHGNSTAEAEGTAESEVHPEGEAEHHGNSTAEAEGSAESEVHPGGEAEHHGNSTAEAEGTAESEVHPGGEAEHHGNSTAEAEGSAESEVHPGGEAEHHGNSTAEAEGSAEGEGGAEGEAPGSAPHPMDCTDIVIGSARGAYSRIGDYYTRDRSTPVHDEYLGGSNGLTAGLVWEEGQYTYMLFRKKLDAGTDPADHSLKDEVTNVIWAFGQQPDTNGMYNHNPNSALEAASVSIPDFYRKDELKYHGHQGQRGATTINFYSNVNKNTDDEDNCMQGSCKTKDCGLDFAWTYDASSDVITFNITGEYLADDQWIGLGFSDDKNMPNSDVVFGGVDGTGPFVTDGWLDAKQPPRETGESQDAILVSGGKVDVRTNLIFTRKRITGDPQDLDLDKCRYVFFAKGGKIRSRTTITKHSSTPFISIQRICFGVCGAVGPEAVTYVTPMSLRLDTDFQAKYEDKNSIEYVNFVDQIRPPLETHFRTELGSKFQSLTIKDLRQGSVIVNFEVLTKSDGTVQEVNQEVQTAAQPLAQQQIASYSALSVVVNDTYIAPSSGDAGTHTHAELLTETEIIIIAVVLALIAVALLVCICKFWESRRARRNDKQRVMKTDSSSQSSGSGSGGSGSTGDRKSVKEGMMSYGQFIATAHDNGDHKAPPHYPAFNNPGYETAGYKNVP